MTVSNILVPIKRVGEDASYPLPEYATSLSSGVDLSADIKEGEDIIIKPLHYALIPTGIALAIPQGFEAQVRSRSGLAAKHGIFTLNSPGTIDADYRGEIKVILFNLGDKDFTISRGMRIAQLVFAPVIQASWQEVDELDDTARGAGGFGSTGIAKR